MKTPPQAAEAVPQSCGGVVGKVILRFLHLQGIRRQARLLLPRHRPAPSLPVPHFRQGPLNRRCHRPSPPVPRNRALPRRFRGLLRLPSRFLPVPPVRLLWLLRIIPRLLTAPARSAP